MKNIFILSLFSNAAWALSSVFIPLLAKDFGASFFEMGILMAIYQLAGFISYYIFGRASDLTGKRRVFIRVGLIVSSIVFLSQILMRDVLSMIVIRFLAGLSAGIFIFPLTAYIASFDRYKRNLGRFGGYGAIGWIIGFLIAGLVNDYNMIFIISAILLFFAFIMSLFVPERKQKRIHVPRFPLQILKNNKRIYSSIFVRNIGASAVWPTFVVYVSMLGADKFWIAMIWSFNAIFQFISMNMVGKISEKKNEGVFIKVGYFLSAVVFLMYMLATSYLYIIPAEIILGFSWGFLWTGSLIHLSSRNIEKATSTGLLGSSNSLARVVGPLVGGIIVEFFGFEAVFFFALVMSLIAYIMTKKL